jgi:hypothetical protein
MGKRYHSKGVPAQIVRLSPSGAELECGFEMDYFVSVQITLPQSSGTELFIDGKVVAPGDNEGRWIVRFSGLDQPVAEVIQEILAPGGDS